MEFRVICETKGCEEYIVYADDTADARDIVESGTETPSVSEVTDVQVIRVVLVDENG